MYIQFANIVYRLRLCDHRRHLSLRHSACMQAYVTSNVIGHRTESFQYGLIRTGVTVEVQSIAKLPDGSCLHYIYMKRHIDTKSIGYIGAPVNRSTNHYALARTGFL